jgi:hypothetical protein
MSKQSLSRRDFFNPAVGAAAMSMAPHVPVVATATPLVFVNAIQGVGSMRNAYIQAAWQELFDQLIRPTLTEIGTPRIINQNRDRVTHRTGASSRLIKRRSVYSLCVDLTQMIPVAHHDWFSIVN